METKPGYLQLDVSSASFFERVFALKRKRSKGESVGKLSLAVAGELKNTAGTE